MKRFLLTLFLSPLMLFVGCSSEPAGSYRKISAETALNMINNEEVIVIDVRTQEEFDEGHIKNAILIPDYEIPQKAADILPDKNAAILVYCRSGRRSAAAGKELIKLGYKNVYDFGGILDWKYEIVK